MSGVTERCDLEHLSVVILQLAGCNSKYGKVLVFLRCILPAAQAPERPMPARH